MGTKDSRGQGFVEFSVLVWVTGVASPGYRQHVSKLPRGLLESQAEFWLFRILTHTSYELLGKRVFTCEWRRLTHSGVSGDIHNY